MSIPFEIVCRGFRTIRARDISLPAALRLSGDRLAALQDAALHAWDKADPGDPELAYRQIYKILCYLIFSGFCVTQVGTSSLASGLWRVEDSIANTRAIGAVLGASSAALWWVCWWGSPAASIATAGGFTALACTFSTIAEGLLGGLVHRHFVARHRLDLLFSPG